MEKPRFLYKFFIINLFGLIYLNADAQFATKICDYLPAPGQYTNSDFFGTPTAANSIVGTNKGLVSLGAYGGSITVYFADGIKNDPANPYGVDFTIYGNPTLTWSEPGIIQVMKDENKNGLPDDTWYEIAGSDHYWNSTISNYEVTYLNSGQSQASDIQWTDNQFCAFLHCFLVQHRNLAFYCAIEMQLRFTAAGGLAVVRCHKSGLDCLGGIQKRAGLR